MNRSSKLYRFMKRCETPPTGSLTFLFLSLIYNILLVKIGVVLMSSRIRKIGEVPCIMIPICSNGDIAIFYRGFNELKKANSLLNEPHVLLLEALVNPAKTLGFRNLVSLHRWEVLAINKSAMFYPDSRAIQSYPWIFFDITRFQGCGDFNRIPITSPSEIKQTMPKTSRSGCCVILSPYEQSMTSMKLPTLPVLFWERLCEELVNQGFTVLTNCDGVNEHPIKGSTRFFPPLIELGAAVEYAGYSISIRTGFSDWCSSAPTAKQVVLYPNRKFQHRFQMANVWGRNDILELVYGDGSLPMDELLERILEFIGKRKGMS